MFTVTYQSFQLQRLSTSSLVLPDRPRLDLTLILPELQTRESHGGIAEIAAFGEIPLKLPDTALRSRVDRRNPVQKDVIDLVSIPAPQLVRMLNDSGVLDLIQKKLTNEAEAEQFDQTTLKHFKERLSQSDTRSILRLISEVESRFDDYQQTRWNAFLELGTSPRVALTAKLLSESFDGVPAAKEPIAESFSLHLRLGARKMALNDESGTAQILDDTAIHSLLLDKEFIDFQNQLSKKGISPNDQIVKVVEFYANEPYRQILDSPEHTLILGLLRSRLPELLSGTICDFSVVKEVLAQVLESKRDGSVATTEESQDGMHVQETVSSDEIGIFLSKVANWVHLLKTAYDVPVQRGELMSVLDSFQREELKDPDTIGVYAVLRRSFAERWTYNSLSEFLYSEKSFSSNGLPFLKSLSIEGVRKEFIPQTEQFLNLFKRSLGEIELVTIFQDSQDDVVRMIPKLIQSSDFREFIAAKMNTLSERRVPPWAIADWTVEFLEAFKQSGSSSHSPP